MSDGGPAFPTDGFQFVHEGFAQRQGMSLRDWFAGQALAGLLANPDTPDQMIGLGYDGSKAWAAEFAYATADAMLERRAKAEVSP